MSEIICLKCLHIWKSEASGKPQCPDCFSRVTVEKEEVDEALKTIREEKMEKIELPTSVSFVLADADPRFPVAMSIFNNLIELAEELEEDG